MAKWTDLLVKRAMGEPITEAEMAEVREAARRPGPEWAERVAAKATAEKPLDGEGGQ